VPWVVGDPYGICIGTRNQRMEAADKVGQFWLRQLTRLSLDCDNSCVLFWGAGSGYEAAFVHKIIRRAGLGHKIDIECVEQCEDRATPPPH
jgi:hypothetical protein